MSLLMDAPIVSKSDDLYPGYSLHKLLGRGAGGEVWQAENEEATPVALKFLPCTGTLGASQELRSLQLVRKLYHPGIVRIDQVWCGLKHLVVAMELADGSLADLLEAYQTELGTPIIAQHACLLLAQVADVLDFLNSHRHDIGGRRVGIQHCDVKPGNLLLFGDTVKLSDFGLTSPLHAALSPHRRAGTYPYAAPEVLQGRLSDQTDQYALAVSYCLLRGGRLPFPDAPREPVGNVLPPPDLTMLPDAERPIVRRALAPVPLDRWRSCRELVAQLEKVVY